MNKKVLGVLLSLTLLIGCGPIGKSDLIQQIKSGKLQESEFKVETMHFSKAPKEIQNIFKGKEKPLIYAGYKIEKDGITYRFVAEKEKKKVTMVFKQDLNNRVSLVETKPLEEIYKEK